MSLEVLVSGEIEQVSFTVEADTLTSELRNNDEQCDLLFADDLVFIADTEEELQERLLAWKGALERKGFQLNIGKTELMTSSREGHEGVNILVEYGTVPKQNNELNYSGSIITEEGGTEKAVRQRVKETWQK
ncbi:uncharacterized protein [Macrobrachium rosenbergii]|uniref:uncharacterized protein n=1 Tax=Macrobrachium rosenbergii TaxID=79674 RepID=UPI0034D75A6B